MSQRLKIACIVIASAILRVAFAPLGIFAGDEIRIFEPALNFFRTGNLPYEGAAVVYSGTSLPGSLLGLLTGLPLFLTHGNPIGSAYSVVVFTMLGLWMTYRIYASLFPRIPREWLCAFIFFTPWSLLMSSVMNPHFLLPFSALFVWGVLEQFRKPRDLKGSAAVAFSLVMILQLHLAVFAVLATLIALLALRLLKLPNWRGTLGGLAAGSLTLIPYFLHRLHDTQPHKSVVTSNIVVHWNHLLQFPAYFFRLLTFATGEITRFLVGGTGYLSVGTVLNRIPWLWPLYLIAMIGSGVLLVLALRFFAQSARVWLKFHKQPSHLTFEEKTDLFVWLSIGITGVLYAFSIKGPSAHTFWVWFPVSLYPILKIANQEIQWNGKTGSRIKIATAIYLVSATAVALIGYGYAIELQRLGGYVLP